MVFIKSNSTHKVILFSRNIGHISRAIDGIISRVLGYLDVDNVIIVIPVYSDVEKLCMVIISCMEYDKYWRKKLKKPV